MRSNKYAGWGVSALATAIVMALVGCSRQTSTTAQATRTSAGPRTVQVVRVVEQPLDLTLSMPAELTAYQSVAVYPRVTGFVKSISVDRGSRVRTGQVLAVLEAPELTAQRAEAQSKVLAAEAQLAAVRSKADADTGTYEKLKAASSTPGVVAGNDLVLAQKAVEGDTNQVMASQQSAEAARQVLAAVRDIEGYLRITAPFDGVITERNVHPGALVGPASGTAGVAPMLRLVQDQRLRVVVPVPEAYSAGVTTGTKVPFSVAAFPGEKFVGTIARVSRAVDVQTRTMAVELDVTNANGRLAPGTYSQVQWPVRRSGPTLLVPSSSIASTTGRTFVVRVRSGKTEWVDVSTGVASGPLIEVFGDLKPGDEIAVRGTDELRPGTDVKTAESQSP